MGLDSQLDKLRTRRSEGLADAVGQMAKLLTAMPGPTPGRDWALIMSELAKHGVLDLLMELVRPNQNLHVRSVGDGSSLSTGVWETTVFLPDPTSPGVALALDAWTRFWDREVFHAEIFNLGRFLGEESDWIVRASPRTDFDKIVVPLPVQFRVWQSPCADARKLSKKMENILPSAPQAKQGKDRM